MAFPQSFLISLGLHAMVVGAVAGTLFFDRGNARERDLRERDFVVELLETVGEEPEELEKCEELENSENSEISENSEPLPEPEPPPVPAEDEILVPASSGEAVPADFQNTDFTDLNTDFTEKNQENPVPASEISQEKSVKSVSESVKSVFEKSEPASVPASVPAGTDTTPATLRYRHRAVPAFPRAERLRGRTGTVVLRLTLSPSGELLSVAVKQSSGSRAFDAAAIAAARASTYIPAPNATVPVTAEARYEFR